MLWCLVAIWDRAIPKFPFQNFELVLRHSPQRIPLARSWWFGLTAYSSADEKDGLEIILVAIESSQKTIKKSDSFTKKSTKPYETRCIQRAIFISSSGKFP